MTWKDDFRRKCVSADEAAALIRSGDNIMVSGANSAPPDIVNALCRRYKELENVTIWSGLLMYGFDFLKREYKGHINYVTIFYGPVERMFAGEGSRISRFIFQMRTRRPSGWWTGSTPCCVKYRLRMKKAL